MLPHNSIHRRGVASLLDRRLTQIVLGCVAALLVVLYIGLTNSVATQGYRLSALQSQIDALKKENEDIQLNVAAAQSLPRLQAQASIEAFQPVGQIEYLAANGSSVALK